MRSGRRRALAGAAFKVTASQQKQGKHADRVEVQLATPGDRRPDTGAVGQGDGQRHRHIHGQVAGAQVARGAFEKRRTAVEHDRRGQKQRNPTQNGVQLGAEVDVEFRPGGHGRHHRLEPQQPGHTEAAQGAAVLPRKLLGGLVGLIRVGGVANLAQLGHQLRQRQLQVVPAQQQAVVGQVQAGVGHAWHIAQVFLDQPAASGATDAFDHQHRFGMAMVMADEALLNIVAVVQRQFVLQLLGQGLWVGAGFAAVLVVVLKAASDDGFGNGLTTGAAECAQLAQHLGVEAAAGRDRQGAVVARVGLSHHIMALQKPQSCTHPRRSGLVSRKGREAAPGFMPRPQLPGQLRWPFATQGRSYRCSAPWMASSPSWRVTPCSTFSSSNKRQMWPSWLPSSSTKRRPSTLSSSWPT
ncbi:hypothetical protein PS623_04382 [Pseudomonas fluorescens]|nr:hypothetical protein PS623_04382 [Pseudomonas fluorescens]